SMHVPLAWPDGADGGRGGDVILEVDASTTTLQAYHHRPHQRATGGGFGKGDLRHGARGEDLVLPVPDGTVVTGADGTVLADLVGDRKSTRLNSSHVSISYAVFCLKKKN